MTTTTPVQSAKRYTLDLVHAMLTGLLQQKTDHGINRLHNNTFEDLAGYILKPCIKQRIEVVSEDMTIYHIKVSLRGL